MFGWDLNRRLITGNRYILYLQTVWFSKKEFNNQYVNVMHRKYHYWGISSSCSNKPGFIYKNWSTKIPAIYTFHLPYFNYYCFKNFLQSVLFKIKAFLEKEMATHSVFLPGKVHGQSSLADSSPWGYMTEHACMRVEGDGLVTINW